MFSKIYINYLASNLAEGDLILLREETRCFNGKQFKVIGPPMGSCVPILLKKGEGYSIEENGAQWGIDTKKYRGQNFIRVFFDDIVGTTKQIPKGILERAILH